MSIAIVDAREWQNVLDLRTGRKTGDSGPVVEMVKGILKRHPYPGDMDRDANRWVTDTALDLIERYEPRLVFLTYAAQYFAGRYTAMSKEERAVMIAEAFSELERFINLSGFSVIVVGTGDMTPLLDTIDVTGLDGFALATHWSARYAGLHGPTSRDLETLNDNPLVEGVIAREEILDLFGEMPDRLPRVPDYLMLARTGYAFKMASGVMRRPIMVPSLNLYVPLHAPGPAPEGITGIREMIEGLLADKKVALIVMEGVGLSEFLLPFTPCRNGLSWHYYEPGEAQYLTINSGRHRFLDYPTGYKYFEEVDAAREYPFSGYFTSVPEGTFAGQFPGKSIAVGNKSMFMHMAVGADLSVECFARNLYNQGTMAVIHREDKI
jgi:hypothetical protein